MASVRDDAARTISAAHVRMYRTTGGLLGGLVAGMPVLLLTTTGRRSGQPRTTPLTYLPIDGRIFVVASYGGSQEHPDWYLNLDADPDVEVQRWRKTVPMQALTISGADRERIWGFIVWRAPLYRWYQQQTDREIPVVELVPVEDADFEEPVVDLESMSKAELLDIAKELSLRGRSTMNKAQLIEALHAEELEIDDDARGM